MKAKIKLIHLLFCLLLALSFSGCKDGATEPETEQPNNVQQTTSVTLSVTMPGTNNRAASNSQAPLFAAVGTVEEVQSVTVEIPGQVEETAMTRDGDRWTITLPALPVGTPLTFNAHAYSGDTPPKKLFTGTTRQTLTSNDVVYIEMAPVDDGAPTTFPKINKIMIPKQVVAGLNASVIVSVEAGSGETLKYTIDSPVNGGTFDPSSDTITLSGSTVQIALNYTASNVTGTYTHSITLTNSQGNSTKVDFNMVVSDTQADIMIQFNPVIASLTTQRKGDKIIWGANVSDDALASALRYQWSFDASGDASGDISGGDASNDASGDSFSTSHFENATANPAVMTGYTAQTSGTLKLVVTDGEGQGGSSSIYYFLKAGQFPDNVVVEYSNELPEKPGALSFTDTNGNRNSLQGTLYITKASNEVRVDQYKLYWGSNDVTKQSETPITTLDATGDNLTYYVSKSIPAGATHFLVYSVNGFGESIAPSALKIEDKLPTPVTTMVANITTGGGSSNPRNLTVKGDRLYFISDTSYNYAESDYQRDHLLVYKKGDISGDVWESYIPYGTDRRKDIDQLTFCNDLLYFTTANDTILWSYNTQNNEQKKVKYTEPGSPQGFANFFCYETPADGMYSRDDDLYFSVADMNLQDVTADSPISGKSYLYRTNTSGIITGIPAWTNYYTPQYVAPSKPFTISGDLYFFSDRYNKQSSRQNNYSSLYKISSNGYFDNSGYTVGSIFIYENQVTATGIGNYTDITKHGKYYFSGIETSESSRKIFRISTNGSSVTEIPTIASNPDHITSTFEGLAYPMGTEIVYYTAETAENGRELWMYDAATNETKLVADINPGGGSSSPENLILKPGYGNRVLYFTADDGVHGRELWMYDGSGTPKMVKDVNPNGSSNPSDLTFLNDEQLYFSADDGENGRELWSHYLQF